MKRAGKNTGKKNFEFTRLEVKLCSKNKHCLVNLPGMSMGIAERKELEKEIMRKRILEAAMKLFLSEGYEKTSIRKIADAIEYSPATVYLYFKDKTAIFTALQKIAFDLFYDTMAESLKVKDMKKRLDRLGEQYFKFSMEHPEYYDLMFIMNAPIAQDADLNYMDLRALNLLTETINEVSKQKGKKSLDVEATTFLLWGFTHGFASLIIRKRLDMMPEAKAKNLFGRVIKLLDNLLYTT